MASFTLGSFLGGPITNTGDGSVVIRRAGELIASSTVAALDLSTEGGERQVATVQGTIINTHVQFGDAIAYESTDIALGGGLRLTIVDGGFVQAMGGSGLYLNGEEAVVVNDGHLQGGRAGIMSNFGAEVVNTGLLHGAEAGVALYLAETSEVFDLRNSGTISSDWLFGVWISEQGGALHLTNTGEILGNVDPGWITGIVTRDQADRVETTGTIAGGVSLGGGADLLSNGGTILGDVDLGDGADTLSNTGRIQGDVTLAAGRDSVQNSGVITGTTTSSNVGFEVNNSGQMLGGFLSQTSGTLRNTGEIFAPADTALNNNTAVDMAGVFLNSGKVEGNVRLFATGGMVNDGSVNGTLSAEGQFVTIRNAGALHDVTLDASNTARFYNEVGGLVGDVSVTGLSGEATNLGALRSLSVSVSSSVQITNAGTITDALDVSSSGLILRNSGMVQGDMTVADISWDNDGAHDTLVENTGSVFGNVAVEAASGTLVNSGWIGGDVTLSILSETYRALGDGSVQGEIRGGDGADTIIGGALADRIDGGRQVDDLRGGAGGDVIFGDSGNDTLMGQAGDDDLNGGGGGDILLGGAGDDYLFGSAGNDSLMGNAGDDDLDGGTGKDVLNGGRGADILTGGTGADRFVFGLAAGSDTIIDFENGFDRIDLRAYDLIAADLAGAGVITQSGSSAIVDLTALGGRGEIVVADMAGLLAADDFIL